MTLDRDISLPACPPDSWWADEEDDAADTEREPTEDEMQAYREQRDRFAESWDCWVGRECREAGR